MYLARKSAVLLALLIITVSCTTKLTPDQRRLWALNVYNAQCDLWLEQVLASDIVPEDRAMLKENPDKITEDLIRADLSEDQRKILRVKKDILIELKPLVTADTLTLELQNRMIVLINRLLTELGD